MSRTANCSSLSCILRKMMNATEKLRFVEKRCYASAKDVNFSCFRLVLHDEMENYARILLYGICDIASFRDFIVKRFLSCYALPQVCTQISLEVVTFALQKRNHVLCEFPPIYIAGDMVQLSHLPMVYLPFE